MSELTVRERLAEAGLAIPEAPKAIGAYVPATRAGELVFTAGQLPLVEGVPIATGTVGEGVTAEQAYECARTCALNALAAASTVCDLDSVSRVLKLTGYVASTGGFHGQPLVVNGASEVLGIAFGDAGLHAREAVGVAALPLGVPVEVSLVLQCS